MPPGLYKKSCRIVFQVVPLCEEKRTRQYPQTIRAPDLTIGSSYLFDNIQIAAEVPQQSGVFVVVAPHELIIEPHATEE